MNWLIWKQHRKQFLMLSIALVLYAALAVPMGLHFWHTYQQALVSCKETHTCSQLSTTILQSGLNMNLNPSLPNGGFNILSLLILVMPFILGMFYGVPLIAREYVNKTNLLIWTRSVSRRKWLTSKLAWILVTTAIFAAIFASLTTWEARAGNALSLARFSSINFAIQGIVPIGYAIFAVSIGIALGTWLKRTMTAIGLTLVIMLAALIVIGNFVRPHYATAYTTNVWTNQIGGPPPSSSQVPNGAWITGNEVVNKQGQTLNWANPPKQCIIPADELPQAPQQSSGGGHAVHEQAIGNNTGTGSISSFNGGPNVSGSCLETAGYHYIVSYQPSYRYWDFQRIELGLYLVLSIIPIGATYWLVLRRDA